MENNVLEQDYGKNVFNDEVMQAKLQRMCINPGRRRWRMVRIWM